MKQALPVDSLHDNIAAASLFLINVVDSLHYVRVTLESLHDLELPLTVDEHLSVLASHHFHSIFRTCLAATADFNHTMRPLNNTRCI
jgi:hypothetical protein